jgi:hypothetical protein
MKMAKLTDTQLIILSSAVARDDGATIVPAKMNRGAATKTGSSLVARKLMREIRSKPGMPIWREDENGKNLSLLITRAGRDAIGVDAPTNNAATAIEPRKRVRKDVDALNKSSEGSKGAPRKINASDIGEASPAITSPRTRSKQAMVIGMLSVESGATLTDLVEATGWLPHTTRAALTGLRKRGFLLVRCRGATNVSTYRITGRPAGLVA